MKAVIPVAGIGRRLRPHTFSTPKALVPVAGKPILGYILDELPPLGIRDVILIVGHMGDRIRAYVDAAYSFATQYVVQENTHGIAHALYQCRSSLDEEPILIILGDTVYNTDFSALRNGLTSSAIGVKALQGDLRRYGLVEVDGDRVIRLVEKPDNPPSNLVIAGIYYILNPPALVACIDELIRAGCTTRGEYQLTDALQMMVERGEWVTTFPVEEWYDCGTPDRLLATNRRLLELRGRPCHMEGSTINPPVYIAEGAQIASSVIGPFVSIAGGVSVSHAVITNSIICEGATVQDCRLDTSLVGANATVKGHMWHVNVGELSEVIL